MPSPRPPRRPSSTPHPSKSKKPYRPASRAPSPRGPRNDAEPSDAFITKGVRIVHEDEHLIIVDKPVGLVTALPSPARAGGSPFSRSAGDNMGQPKTLFDWVKRHVRGLAPSPYGRKGSRARAAAPAMRPNARQKIWIIHRLDKEASGLLVFAKDEKTYAWLKEDFRAKRVHRLYLAVARGVIGEPGHTGTCQSFLPDEDAPPTPLMRKPEGRGVGPRGKSSANKFSADGPQGGKLAVSHYRVIASANDRTLVQVRLETGRKNQIRIHMAELGHPLLGDFRFGGDEAKTNLGNALGRLALHAAELGFTNPATGQSMRFRSEPPISFYHCVGAKPPRESPHAEHAESHDAASSEHTAAAQPPIAMPGEKDTSWDRVADWYDGLLEDRGSDHYENVILPGALRLLEPAPGMRVLDLACGQGVLSRRLAALGTDVVGVDAAPSLIGSARARNEQLPSNITPPRYEVCDARDIAPLALHDADAAVCVMALSNIDPLDGVMRGVATALKPGGAFVWIIVHPAFRAAGQTSWGWDTGRKTQYRRVDGYLSPGQKAIVMNPGGRGDVTTLSFHRPLQAYVQAMSKYGLLVERLEEWPSLRASTSGPRAAEENRARREIPLFLGVRAVKYTKP